MPLHPSPIIKSVLFSSNPDTLRAFYVGKNLKFIAYTFSEQIHHISTNAGLVIVDRQLAPPKGKSPNGFFIYHVPGIHKKWNMNACTIGGKEELVVCNFIIPEEIHHQLSSPHEATWISILRQGDIEAAKLFFAAIGDWQQEKHGSGPFHYSLTNHGNIFEIYPLSRTSSVGTEFIIQKNAPRFHANHAGDFFDPEGRRIRCI